MAVTTSVAMTQPAAILPVATSTSVVTANGPTTSDDAVISAVVTVPGAGAAGSTAGQTGTPAIVAPATLASAIKTIETDLIDRLHAVQSQAGHATSLSSTWLDAIESDLESLAHAVLSKDSQTKGGNT